MINGVYDPRIPALGKQADDENQGIMALFNRSDAAQQAALRPTPAPQMGHPSAFLFGVAALLNALDRKGQPGGDLLSGYMQGAQQRNQQQLAQFQQEQQRQSGLAALYGQQAERAQGNQRYRAQLDHERYREGIADRQFDAGLDYKRDTASDKDQQASVKEWQRVLGDPKSTIPARQVAIQKLTSVGYSFTRDQVEAFLSPTYYETGQGAKTGLEKTRADDITATQPSRIGKNNAQAGQATAQTGLIKEKTVSERQFRAPRIAGMNATTAEKNARSAYLNEATRFMPDNVRAKVMAAEAALGQVAARGVETDAHLQIAARKSVDEALRGLSAQSNVIRQRMGAAQKAYNDAVARQDEQGKRDADVQYRTQKAALDANEGLQESYRSELPKVPTLTPAQPNPKTFSDYQGVGVKPAMVGQIGPNGAKLEVRPMPVKSAPKPAPRNLPNIAEARRAAMNAIHNGKDRSAVMAHFKKLYGEDLNGG